MTIQTIRLDLYDYGASTGTVTVRNASTLALVDTADSVTKNSEWSSRYDAIFNRVSVLPAGVYPIGVSFNGIPFLMYVTLTGVDGEVALARTERVVELDSATIEAIADAVGTGGGDWSSTEKAQIRYRLGLDGTATAPSDPDGETITIDPGSGNITTGYATCLDPEGDAQSGVKVYAQLIEAASSSTGFAFDASQSSVVSASNGVAQMPLIKGATYLIWRGKQDTGRTITVPSNAGSTYALPSLVGY